MTAEAKVILTAQDRTAAAFRSARSNLDSLNRGLGSVKNLLGTFGVGFSVAAITTGLFSAAKSAIAYGDELQKAAAKTGISASDFGTLAEAAKMADVDMQSLSKALQKMQIAMSNAASGAKDPQEALAALGLKISDVANLDADKQFELIADRISKLKDPADKVRAAVELFGKAGADLLPFFEQGAEGIRKAREEIEKIGGKLTDEQIQKLADADDAIKRLDRSWNAFARTLTANVAPVLSNVLDVLSGANNAKDRQRMDQIRALLQSRGPQADAFADTPALKAELARLELQNRPQLLGETRRATRPKSGTATPPGYGGEKETDAERRARLKKELDAQFPDITLSAQKFTTSAVEEVNKAIREQSLPQYQRDAEQWAKEAADAYAALAAGSITGEQYSARLKELNDKYLEDIKLGPKMEEVEQFSKLSVFAEEAARNMQDAFAEFFYSFDGGLKGMLSSFVDTIRKMVAQLLASQILTAFFNWGAGFFGTGSGIGKFFGSMSKGITGKAIGGPVMAGMPYKVGERGAEMFVPASNGMIIPNHAMAGGVNVNNYITVNDDTDLRRSMPMLVSEITRQSVAAAKAEIKSDAKRYGRIR